MASPGVPDGDGVSLGFSDLFIFTLVGRSLSVLYFLDFRSILFCFISRPPGCCIVKVFSPGVLESSSWMEWGKEFSGVRESPWDSQRAPIWTDR